MAHRRPRGVRDYPRTSSLSPSSCLDVPGLVARVSAESLARGSRSPVRTSSPSAVAADACIGVVHPHRRGSHHARSVGQRDLLEAINATPASPGDERALGTMIAATGRERTGVPRSRPRAKRSRAERSGRARASRTRAFEPGGILMLLLPLPMLPSIS